MVEGVDTVPRAGAARYVELEAVSSYSFLRGASHPEELVRQAVALGFEALGVADRNSFAGVVRVHAAAQAAGLRPLVGARIDLADAPSVLAYPCNRAAYGRLCRLLTEGKGKAKEARGGGGDRSGMGAGAEDGDGGGVWVGARNEAGADTGVRGKAGAGSEGGVRAGSGKAEGEEREGGGESGGRKEDEDGGRDTSRRLRAADLLAWAEGMVLIVLPPERPAPGLVPTLAAWRAAFPGQVWLALRRLLTSPPNGAGEAWVTEAARTAGVPLVATNAVLMHHPDRRPVADVLACLRTGRCIDEMGLDLLKNAERRLKSPEEMARLFRDRPEAVEATLDIAGRIGFSLDQLRLDYPDEAGPGGLPAQVRLERAVREGARARYGARGAPPPVQDQLGRELAIIRRLGYAPYFLTVYDLVRFARSCGILAQGRGSAANSAVCYVLGITAVDPDRIDLLFERFVSEERGEPPDIDVDFEHERREEVIQHVYERWGRHRAALTATVIHYRARLAIREAGKALGLSEEVTSVLAANARGGMPGEDEVRAAGLDPRAPRLRHALAVARTLVGFPRHLSQHPGGFVIGQGRLDEIVPIGPAVMPDRTVIEWDKDDLEALGILKVDVLGLGMLTCLRKGFDLLAAHHGRRLDLDGVPQDDPAVYEMLGRADSLGVFQVESRAQMSFLPRMKPQDFYDLVIEVAIVRPGPIQGGMVHPYLRRRNGVEPIRYPLPELKPVLSKTKGVPIFQEQAMRIAIVGAGFTPEEADKLRRAMATFRRVGTLPRFRTRFLERLVAKGCPPEFAEQCWRQIEGFGEYGFPESHSASFAILVYASAWLKCHYPDVFACALLNSQPMGFYAPAQNRARCAHARGGGAAGGRERERVGLHAGAGHLRGWGRKGRSPARLPAGEGVRGGGGGEAGGGARQRLSRAGRRGAAGRSRGAGDGRPRGRRRVRLARPRAARGVVGGGADQGPPAAAPVRGGGGAGPGAGAVRRVAGGDAGRGGRGRLSRGGLEPAYPSGGPAARGGGAGVTWSGALAGVRAGARVAVTGVVLVRQRPRTARGVIFLTLEDMEGSINVVVWERVFRRFRFEVLDARLMRVEGRVESSESVVNVIADRIVDLSDRLAHLADGAAGGEGSAERQDSVEERRSDAKEGGHGHPRNEARRLFPSRDFH